MLLQVDGIIISVVWVHFDVAKNNTTLYEKEKTKIIFEYGDLKEIIANEENASKSFTVVVPVNTHLNYIGNRMQIKEDSIHRLCLEYLHEKMGNELDVNILNTVKVKKQRIKENNVGEIGDWFYVTPEDMGIEGKVRFLFLESSELEERNGKIVIKELTKEQYLTSIQSLLEAISYVSDQKEKVYLPLIGAGNGNVAKSKDIMQVMRAMLYFNRQKLRQEIHVIINQENRKDVPIYQLDRM